MCDISFVIPIYNKTPEQVTRCLKSIKNIKQINYEVIIINDGSDNQLSRQYESLAKNYSAHYVYQKNEGVSSARNQGINLAQGKFISFLDADDVFNANQFSSSDIDFSKDLIIYNVKKKSRTGEEKEYTLKNWKNTFSIKNLYYLAFEEGLVNWAVGKLFRKSFLIQNNIKFNLKLKTGEDWNFIIDVLSKNPQIKYVDKIIYTYLFDYNTEEEREIRNPLNSLSDAITMYETQFNLLKKCDFSKEEQQLIDIKLCKELAKKIMRIYSNYLYSNKKSAKKEIKQFKKIATKLKNKPYAYDVVTKLRLNMIIKQQYFVIKFYYYLKQFAHKVIRKN